MDKKILYIGGFILPDGNAAAQRVIANAKLFTALGYDVKLVGLSENDFDRPFKYEGLDCINLQYPKGTLNWFRYLLSINSYLKIIKEYNPRFVIAYNHPAIALKKLLDYGRKTNIKILSDCTEWYVGKGNFIHKLIKNIDTKYRMQYVHTELDGIIVISKFLERYYKEKGVNNILLLPPLVDKDNPKWAIAVKQKTQHNGIKLFYAGTGSRKDRLDLIMAGIDNVIKETGKAIELDVYGSSKERLLQNYPEIANIPSFVRLHGRVSHQEVLNALANHDFQIFLRDESISNMAGFPTKFVESVSSGVLVLTNDTSDIKSYIEELGNGFIIDISSKQKLLETLNQALNTEKDELENRKKNINRNRFDYHVYINETKQFLDSVLQ